MRTTSHHLHDKIVEIRRSILRELTSETRTQILGIQLGSLVVSGPGAMMVQLSLYADALRMMHDAIVADGKISPEELQDCAPLIRGLASAFAKVRPSYAPYAALETRQIPQFLEKYCNDRGTFGYLNPSTKWAESVEIFTDSNDEIRM